MIPLHQKIKENIAWIVYGVLFFFLLSVWLTKLIFGDFIYPMGYIGNGDAETAKDMQNMLDEHYQEYYNRNK